MTGQEQIAHLIRHLIRQVVAFARHWPVFNWHPPYRQRLADVIMDLQRTGLVPDKCFKYEHDILSVNIEWSLLSPRIIYSNTTLDEAVELDEAVDLFRRALFGHTQVRWFRVSVLNLEYLEYGERRLLGVGSIGVFVTINSSSDPPDILFYISDSLKGERLLDIESLDAIIRNVPANFNEMLRLAKSYDLSNVIKKIKKSIILMDEWVRVARDAMAEWMRAHPDEYEAMLWLCRQFPAHDRVWYVGIRDALDDLIWDVARRLGVRSHHSDRKRSPKFGDGLVWAEWPTYSLRVGYHTPNIRHPFALLVPSETRRVVEWVRSDVIPTLINMARGRRAGT